MVKGNNGRSNINGALILAKITVLSTLHILKHLIITIILLLIPFTDKENEKQIVEIICQSHTAR